MSEQLDRLVLRLETAGPEREARPLAQVRRGQGVGLRERAEADDQPGRLARADEGDSSTASETPDVPTKVPFDPLPRLENRFRDWNPDVRVAFAQGVSIRYDSGLNRVVCQGCRERPGEGFDLSVSGSGTGSSDGSAGSAGTTTAASDRTGPAGGGATKSGPIDR